jgi:hypothetical protein
VESAGFDGITLQVEAALKGDKDKIPFTTVQLFGNGGCEQFFQPGAPILCFLLKDSAMLHVAGHWVVAASPKALAAGTDWCCFAEKRFNVAFDGATDRLREHVAAILAGRETTITARMPAAWYAVGHRLCRIKAGPAVADFVLSEESPYFVGWGSGAPDDVAMLAQALRADAPQERITAAEDLANLGAPARQALPALRRALHDDDTAVALAAAKALARLDVDDTEGIECIRLRFTDDNAAA